MPQLIPDARSQEYFIRKSDLGWFNQPRRPSPPLYHRPAGSRQKPHCDSPIGPLYEDLRQLQQLSAEQIAIWFAT